MVIGGRGSSHDLSKFISQGATPITEADFLGTILNSNSTVSGPLPHVGKRPLEEPQGQTAAAATTSQPQKKARKSDPGLEAEKEEFQRLHWFLADRQAEVRLEGKTLTAFDCGGEVFKAQRGKTCVELLKKFNKFLEDCDGVSLVSSGSKSLKVTLADRIIIGTCTSHCGVKCFTPFRFPRCSGFCMT